MEQAAGDLLILLQVYGGLHRLRAPAVEVFIEQIAVPWEDLPAPVAGVAKINHVFLFAAVGLVDGFGDAAPTIILPQVHVGAEPGFRLDGAQRGGGGGAAAAAAVAHGGASEGVEVAEIGGLRAALPEQAVAGFVAHEAEEVPVGQSVLLFKLVVEVFEGQIQAPEIALVLIRWTLFGGLINDAQLQVAGAGGGHPGEGAEAEGHGFVEAVESPVPRGPGGGHAGDVEGLHGGAA